MAYYIVIRESSDADFTKISEIVRNAYISNVNFTYWNALLNEATFQAMVLLAAFMFIFIGFPLEYCLLSAPIILIFIYVLIYGTLLMKATELMYNKKAQKCWVAEAFEPYFIEKSPKDCSYRIIHDTAVKSEEINPNAHKKTIIGTVSIMRHRHSEDLAWLFRLAVDSNYRKKGVGSSLIEAAQIWGRSNRINSIECAISECQEGARKMFNNAGFLVKQFYHKKLFGSGCTLQMYHLKCEVRSTFN